MKNPLRNQTTIAPLRKIQRRIFVLAAVAWFCALAVSAFAQGGGQDNSVYLGRQLAVPNTALSRKCITISPLGIYVGIMNATATMGVGVEQYGLDGQFIRTWAASFGNLSGLASDADGMVYAYDVPNAKVSVFGADGSLIRSWGSAGAGDGQFSATSGYMVHAIAVDADKNVYVSDWGNSRIQVFNQQGIFLRKFGTAGDLPGQFKAGPAAVAVSAQQEVLAYDSTVNWYHVVRFSRQGSYLSRTPQNTISAHEDFPIGQGRGAIFGLGGERVFCSSRDGVLAVGAERGVDGAPAVSAIPGTTRLLSTGAYSLLGAVSFPTYVVTRGGAFDRAGNFWAVRDTKVECLERRMRFDLHKPVKSIPQPVVLGASQPAGSQTVDIDYQLSDSDSASVSAALMAFVGGTRSFSRLVVPKTFTASTTGKLGVGVPTGVPHRVSWNAPADLVGQTFANLAFEVIAKDDRSELGVHYVVIPPDANNPTPLKISNKPVQEDDLADVWYWLLASGDSRVSLTGGSVALTAAGQSYISGAPTPLTGTNVANVAHNGTVSTLQGRAFVYKMVNCRPVTAAEKTRAIAGKYNLNSVTDNSVVSLPPPIDILAQPSISSDGTSISVQAQSTVALTYQWALNGVPIAGGTSAQLPTQGLQGGTYTVVVSTGFGSMTSGSIAYSPSPIGTFALVTGGALPASSPLGAIPVDTFYIGKTEVTWGEWQTVRTWAVANGYTDLANVGQGLGINYPVSEVSWFDVVKWCNARSEKEGKTPVYKNGTAVYRTGDVSDPAVVSSANGYRLPSEKEWEFAARGGVQTNGYTYSGSNDLNAVGWYGDNAGSVVHEVGKKLPNELGVYDMSGNLWEWCGSWFYPNTATVRVIRGGDWYFDSVPCKVVDRVWGQPGDRKNRYHGGGFRVVTFGEYALGISVQPSISSDGMSISVQAAGAGTLTYQWALNGAPIAGGTSAQLPTQGLQGGTYTVVVSNGFASVTSGSVQFSEPTISANFIYWGTNSPEGRLTVPSNLLGVVTIDAGFNHSVALKTDGNVVAWGGNGGAQNIATVPASLSNVVEIDCGWAWTLARRSDGSLFAWGANDSSQITSLPSGTNFVQISAGNMHGAALRADGTVVCWGRNDMGQCNVPAGLTGVKQVIAYGHHTVALRIDGTVRGWGVNMPNFGFAPPPNGLSGVTAIAAGGGFCLALKSDGTVVGWGDNSLGQTTVPAGLNNVVKIFAMTSTAFAIKTNGEVVSWGDNSVGQRTIPSLPAGKTITEIRGESYHAFGMTGEYALGISAQPSISSDGMTITVQAEGAGTLTYQWALNGAPIAGGTSAQLPTQGLQGGTYTVVVSNGFASVTSGSIAYSPSPIGTFALVSGGTLPASSQLGAVPVNTFYIGKTEVTWGEWQTARTWAVANGYTDLANVGQGVGDNYPVMNVNWYEVVKWCNALSEQEGKTPVYMAGTAVYRTGSGSQPTVVASANGYRLPSEKEWEFAARGGTQTQGYTYSGNNDLNLVCWYFANAGGASHEVGTKLANELGVCDMSGNAWEWVGNWHTGSTVLTKGGGWTGGNETLYNFAVADRNYAGQPTLRTNAIGFRLATFGEYALGISAQPSISSDGMSITVQAAGAGTLTYQWALNSVPITGGTSSQLPTQGLQSGTYTVVVSNGFASVTSGSLAYAPSPVGTFALVTGGTLPPSSELGSLPVATFYIGKTEVTWGEWQTVRTWAAANGYTDLANAGVGLGNNYPVTNVNWYNAVKWCNARSEKEGKTPVYTNGGAVYRTGTASYPTVVSSANGYRLPSEKEWEFAARGGTQTNSYTYSGSNDLNSVGWYTGNSGNALKEVGKKLPNELGLFDMSGNLWEWCFDERAIGQTKVSRGGVFNDPINNCTVTFRGHDYTTSDGQDNGFRLALSAAP